MTGSQTAIASATAAKASCAGPAPSRQLSGRSGQTIQQPACGSNSPGMRKPSAAGVEAIVSLTQRQVSLKLDGQPGGEERV